ncbi:uncharacterized protein RHOBADRAFT_46435 [Rhodotorula graminis WP1]|uniref:Uncharacterized protein n=1 Tax=Rhodotorula graminis (strain WP1) TaxID=578459 RepID=A0A0N8PZN8_RHOGW|nr:uncharacterized protein RHOBADRAFT_46435 [Rhodotorula graminis WP1]KPV72845.1 hypothetical protein RHOBADRAFT_46435 [Rhodotorula graminis WP1]
MSLRVLSSPLRRCLLTNKVLPCEMMVRFELARPPSTSTSSNSRLVLQPSRVLHPRFEDRLSRQGSTGKAMWVTCWAEAVAVLAQKGSYKRLNSSAVMLPPRAVTAHVHSLLARRVAHEAELVAERVKAWPAASIPDVRRAPVLRVRVDELESTARELDAAGRRLVGVLDLSPLPSTGEVADPAPRGPFSSNVPLASAASSARRYHLPTFLTGLVLPPSSLSPPSPTADPPDPSAHLLALTRHPLDSLVDFLSRRLARLDSTSSPSPPPPSEGDLFVLSAPKACDDAAAQRQAEDLVPLVLALERCRMWSGEAWAGERGEEEENAS